MLHKNFLIVNLLILSTCATAMPEAHGQDQKPVLTVALSSVDDLTDKITFITSTVGRPNAGHIASGMIRSFTVGLDRTRPAGIVVTTDGEQLTPLGLVPVTDLKQFFASMAERFGEPEDLGNGIMELALPVPIYVKEQEGWALISQSEEALQNVSGQPTKLLTKLTENYDLAFQGRIQNVPEQYRQRLLDQMTAVIERQLDQLPDDQRELQQQLHSAQIQQWKSLLNDVDELSFGWKIDDQAKNTYIDFKMKAVPGTRLARQYASLNDTSSKFTGFLKEKAAVKFNWAYGIPEEDVEQTLAVIQPLRDSTKQQLLESSDLDEESHRQAAAHVVDILFDVMEQTIRTGKADGGGSFNIEPQNFSLMMGALVEDSRKLEEPLKELAEKSASDNDMPKVKFNADEYRGCRFHTISVAITDEEATKWVGDKIEVAVGIGDQEVYLSIGNDSVGQLKRVMDATAADTEANAIPTQFYVYLAPIIRFASQISDNLLLGPLADALAATDDGGKISMISKGIENGATVRMKVESGVLEAFGRTVGAMQGVPLGAGAGE